MDKSPKAVALKYDRKKNNAPRVTAKGRGEIAEKIIEVARGLLNLKSEI
jgi:flagellar biosynthesis protein